MSEWIKTHKTSMIMRQCNLWMEKIMWKYLENQRKLEGKNQYIHPSEAVDKDLSGCTIVFMDREPEFSGVALILPFSNFWALPGAYFFFRRIHRIKYHIN